MSISVSKLTIWLRLPKGVTASLVLVLEKNSFLHTYFTTSLLEPVVITGYLSKSLFLITGCRDMMTDQHECVSGQVKELAVTKTCSLWNNLKFCVWDAGSQGHGLSPVPTTQRLCPPPSINRDSHSYIPPIHQSSQHIATGKKERKKERERGRERELAWTRLRILNEEMQLDSLQLIFTLKWCFCYSETLKFMTVGMHDTLQWVPGPECPYRQTRHLHAVPLWQRWQNIG